MNDENSAVDWSIEIYDADADAWVSGTASSWHSTLGVTVTVMALELDSVPVEPSPELRLVACADGGGSKLFERVRDLIAKSGDAPQTKAERAAAIAALDKKERKEIEKAEKAERAAAKATAAAAEKEAKDVAKVAAKQATDDEKAAKSDAKAAAAEEKAANKAAAARLKKTATPAEVLGMAARQGDLAQIQQLLEAMPKPAARKKAVNRGRFEGMSALYWAATYGHLEVAEFLLRSGAKVNLACKGGVTPLMGAAFAGKTATARLLLAHKASIYATDSSGLNVCELDCFTGLLVPGLPPWQGEQTTACQELKQVNVDVKYTSLEFWLHGSTFLPFKKKTKKETYSI